MHRAAGFFGRSWYLAMPAAALAAAPVPAAWAVPITSLYVVMVPAASPAQAAEEAMRVELVRLTGTRQAASDPALAGLIDDASRYVQLERTTTSGQVQVLFDEPTLSAAISASGRSLWGADRPLLWIALPAENAQTDAALRARLAAAAGERGLPITIVSASANSPGTPPAAAPSVAVAPGAAAAAATSSPSTAAPSATGAGPVSAQNALAAARSAGASAALVAQLSGADPTSLRWTLASADTSGQWVGGPELAIDNAADQLSTATRALDQAPVAQYDCQILGVGDLAALVNVLAAVHSAPGVTDVSVSEVQGDALTLRVQARGGGAEVERALASERLRRTGPGANGLLEYRYVSAP